jgi:hypothetical protein
MMFGGASRRSGRVTDSYVNARIRVMRRTTLTSTCKNEAVEPRTIVIIMRFLGGVMY